MEADAAAANPPVEEPGPAAESSESRRVLAITLPVAAVALLAAAVAAFVLRRRTNATRAAADERLTTAEAFHDLEAAEKSRGAAAPVAFGSRQPSLASSLSSQQPSGSSGQASLARQVRLPSLGRGGRSGDSRQLSLGAASQPSLGVSSDRVRPPHTAFAWCLLGPCLLAQLHIVHGQTLFAVGALTHDRRSPCLPRAAGKCLEARQPELQQPTHKEQRRWHRELAAPGPAVTRATGAAGGLPDRGHEHHSAAQHCQVPNGGWGGHAR